MTEQPRGFGTDDHPHNCFPAIPSPEIAALQRKWQEAQEEWYRRERRNYRLSLAFLVPAIMGVGLIVIAICRTENLVTIFLYIFGYVLAVPVQMMGTYLMRAGREIGIRG